MKVRSRQYWLVTTGRGSGGGMTGNPASAEPFDESLEGEPVAGTG